MFTFQFLNDKIHNYVKGLLSFTPVFDLHIFLSLGKIHMNQVISDKSIPENT